jgi:hypothetical protein
LRCSYTSRTARSRNSGENLVLVVFVVFIVAPVSQIKEPPQNPGRFIPPLLRLLLGEPMEAYLAWISEFVTKNQTPNEAWAEVLKQTAALNC